jgi:hypothetical protein
MTLTQEQVDFIQKHIDAFREAAEGGGNLVAWQTMQNREFKALFGNVIFRDMWENFTWQTFFQKERGE